VKSAQPPNVLDFDPALQSLHHRVDQIASSDATVLICGEPGTRKEQLASTIHATSRRARHPLVKVYCAGLSAEHLERKLFGLEEGVFEEASAGVAGCMEVADGGTLFLDEVGDVAPPVQVKLAQFLEDHTCERVGGSRARRVDVRVITATSKNLEEAVRRGQFREDLYYRINVVPISIPPLRDRRDEILPLAEHFLARYSQRCGKSVKRISTLAVARLLAHDWPGNEGELENWIEGAVLLSSDGVIHEQHLPPIPQPSQSDSLDAPSPFKAAVDWVEREMITEALRNADGNMAAAARELGITPRIVRYKIRKLGIDYRRFSGPDE
jgi:Nif-specific regulatory protein